jgi:hypothetical protein
MAVAAERSALAAERSAAAHERSAAVHERSAAAHERSAAAHEAIAAYQNIQAMLLELIVEAIKATIGLSRVELIVFGALGLVCACFWQTLFNEDGRGTWGSIFGAIKTIVKGAWELLKPCGKAIGKAAGKAAGL